MQLKPNEKEKDEPETRHLEHLPLFLAPGAPRRHDRSSHYLEDEELEELPSLSESETESISRSTSSSSSFGEDHGDRPLPFGWDRHVASNGRTYYINHHRRITTWQHPMDSANSPMADSFDPDLPPGWERRKTSTGRLFFLDHNAGITTWEDPRTSTERGSPLAPLHRKLTYLASHLRRNSTHEEDIWVSQDSLFEDSVEALLNASHELLKGSFGVRLLDETPLPCQDWIDILFSELFSPERKLFQSSKSKPSEMEVDISYLGKDSLRLYSFAGRLHAMAILQQHVFNLSFLPAIYSALGDYDTRGRTDRAASYRSSVSSSVLSVDGSVLLIQKAKAMRMEAFMNAFVELVPPHVLRVFTLSELHVVLAAERKRTTLQNAFLDLPDRFRVSNDALILPSHTNEELLDELMLKLTGFRLETCQYIQELS